MAGLHNSGGGQNEVRHGGLQQRGACLGVSIPPEGLTATKTAGDDVGTKNGGDKST